MRVRPDPALQPAFPYLNYSPIVQVDARELTIDERFAAFHAANPHVYSNLRALAMRWAQSGKRRIGVKALFEVLRYQYHIATLGDEYSLNNNYTSRYARMLIRQEPQLRDLIETRTLRTR